MGSGSMNGVRSHAVTVFEDLGAHVGIEVVSKRGGLKLG